ncbi:MAG: tetratricopeptide repeat protein, partial [Deltaproteobacteria bacterium]|nr:tetratricopeptide repeat protein [Deltaproteobacteria bacterium]
LLGMGKGDGSVEKVREGNRHFQEKRYEEAIANYKEAIKINPSASVPFFNIGTAKYRQGYYASAINDFNAVIAKKDSALEAKAHYNLGNAFFKANMVKQSVYSFKEAVRLNPDDIDARYNLEIALARLKTMEKEKSGFYAGDIPNPLISREGMEIEALSSEDAEAKITEGALEFQKEESGKVGTGNAKRGWRGSLKDMSRKEAEEILRTIRDKELNTFKEKVRFATVGVSAAQDW